MRHKIDITGNPTMIADAADKSESGLQVLPFYIVCDESSSMAGDAIQSLNDGMVEILDEINSDPIVDAKVRVGIVAFNDEARVLFPLTQLSGMTHTPVGVASSSGAHFGNLFRLLKFIVLRDLRALARECHVHPPIVLFLTAGKPIDANWAAMKNEFLDSARHWRPRIVPFGIVGADKSVIAELAHWGSKTSTKIYFMAEDAGSPGPAIKELIRFVNSDDPISPGPVVEPFRDPLTEPQIGTVFVIDPRTHESSPNPGLDTPL